MNPNDPIVPSVPVPPSVDNIDISPIQQSVESVSMNGVPLKAQSGGNLGPMADNEGTPYTLIGELNGKVGDVGPAQSEHSLG